MIDFLKKLFAYIVKIFSVLFSRTKVEVKKNEVVKDEIIKESEVKVLLTSIPDSDYTNSIYNFEPKITKKDFLMLYLKTTNEEIKKIKKELVELKDKVRVSKNVNDYKFELDLIEEKLKLLTKTHKELFNKNVFKNMTFEQKEKDIFKLGKNADAINDLYVIYLYILKMSFESKKTEKSQKNVTLVSKSLVSENTKTNNVVLENKKEVKKDKVVKETKKEIKKEIPKPEVTDPKVIKVNDNVECINSNFEIIELNNKMNKKSKFFKKNNIFAILFLASFIRTIQLRLHNNKIKDLVKSEYINSVNINNTLRNINNIVSDEELEYIYVNLKELKNGLELKEKTYQHNMDSLRRIRLLKQELNLKYKNSKKLRTINAYLDEMALSINSQIKTMPEVKKQLKR